MIKLISVPKNDLPKPYVERNLIFTGTQIDLLAIEK